MSIGSLFFGKCFLFGVSVLMLEYYYYEVFDKIIATMNKMMKAIKYNVNIAIC